MKSPRAVLTILIEPAPRVANKTRRPTILEKGTLSFHPRRGGGCGLCRSPAEKSARPGMSTRRLVQLLNARPLLGPARAAGRFMTYRYVQAPVFYGET